MKKIQPTILAFLLLGLLAPQSHAQKGSAQVKISIIPKPVKMEASSGVFQVGPLTKIVFDIKAEEGLAVGEEFAARLRSATDLPLEVLPAGPKTPKNAVSIKMNEALTRLGNEGYLLSVTKNSITVEAAAPAGLFYGVQSLYQLLPPEVEKMEAAGGISWSVPCVKIEDVPRFRWRGVHLDVGRHFFSKDFIKKYLDLLAMYKMNTFHWHLTEDQGWRIEVKKYPKLTEVGAWRRETMDDGLPHGGYYTQEEIREVVAHAKKRFITVVPEIEMPGHSQAALASYPEISCSGGPFKVGTEWGMINDVYCAGNDQTFAFLEDVLSEVVALFPGEFVHIGGDEVPKTRWKNCAKCQARIKAEGLADENELQSYFIKRIEKFLNAKGKRLIGWDEILEGGLAPNATVMSWRGIVGGIDAAKSGHDVVMSPTSHCYFDYYQAQYNEPRAIGGFLPIDKVYAYEPLPAELTPEEANHILGAQANIWTEWMEESSQVEYMLVPRLLALSEVVWTKKELRNFKDFSERIVSHYDRLAAKEVNFRLPPPDGLGGRKVIFNPVTVTLIFPYPLAEVRYTLDGAEPTRESPLYTQPLEIGQSTVVQARTFLRSGRMSLPARTAFSLVDPEQNGLEYGYYEGSWYRLPDLEPRLPIKTGRVYDLGLEPAEGREDNFALLFKGFIKIDAAGEYIFTLLVDDGGLLMIGNEEVVRNDGLFGIREMSGRVSLEPGKYPLKIAYFQKGGGRQLEVWCEGPGMTKQPIPSGWLFVK